MGNGTGKKVVLLVVWLAMLGGLIFWIKTAGSPPEAVAPLGERADLPKMDPAVLEAQWPQIVAHAAAPARGAATARYTIAEFGDFQCPQCGKARPKLEAMLKEYPDQVNLIFVHRPFPQLHKWAVPASQLSEIAAAQGKFWPMYDVLYSHQEDLEPGFYSDYAAQAGLDKVRLKAALAAGQGNDRVAAASQLGDALQIAMTPTMLVRDNVRKSVTPYVGMNTQKNAENKIPYPGLDQLAARPPWKG